MVNLGYRLDCQEMVVICRCEVVKQVMLPPFLHMAPMLTRLLPLLQLLEVEVALEEASVPEETAVQVSTMVLPARQ
jgi:hypothetical protein